MRAMERSTRREVEVKLPFESAEAARRQLLALGAESVQERLFEDNVILDRTHDPLVPRGMLLRLRRYGDRSWVTLKAPVEGSFRHKVREEQESEVTDPDALFNLFRHLGFAPCYRYQKYRSKYSLGELEVCLDETPIGCFVELEGAPEAIDDAARAMGYHADRYVTASYRELHEQVAAARGEAVGDLVFDAGADETS